MLKVALALPLVLVLCAASARPAKTITRRQARELVLKVLEAQGTPIRSPKFDLEDSPANEKYFPGFYSFDAYFDTASRLATIGHYDVNRRTADVWEGIGCHRLNPPAIRPLQKLLREEVGLSEQGYRKLSTAAPCHPNSDYR